MFIINFSDLGAGKMSAVCLLNPSSHRHVLSYMAERLNAPCRVSSDLVRLLFEDGVMEVHRLLLASHSEFLRQE